LEGKKEKREERDIVSGIVGLLNEVGDAESTKKTLDVIYMFGVHSFDIVKTSYTWLLVLDMHYSHSASALWVRSLIFTAQLPLRLS
jgi:hypothetical protein